MPGRPTDGTNHGNHDSHIYVGRGEVRIDYGPGGGGSVTARAGDLIFNPRQVVHREVTGPTDDAELFVVRVGTGPLTANVGARADGRREVDAAAPRALATSSS